MSNKVTAKKNRRWKTSRLHHSQTQGTQKRPWKPLEKVRSQDFPQWFEMGLRSLCVEGMASSPGQGVQLVRALS